MQGDLPAGLLIQGGQVVFPPSSCAVCVLGSRILLVRQVRPTSTPGTTYELPGGSVAMGETVIDAALRELREEAGVVAASGTLILTLDMDLDRSVHQTSLIEVNECVINDDLVPELAPEWLELDTAFNMVRERTISHAPTVVAVLLQLLKRGDSVEWR
jgi:8-oxo-dGTP pyrophosphatase MutT (NUDIX family)